MKIKFHYFTQTIWYMQYFVLITNEQHLHIILNVLNLTVQTLSSTRGLEKTINKPTLHNLPGTKHLNSVYSMSSAAAVRKTFRLDCTSATVIKAPHDVTIRIFGGDNSRRHVFIFVCIPICGGLCAVVSARPAGMRQRGGKKRPISCRESLRFGRVARRRVSAFAPLRRQTGGLAARAAPRPSMPSSCLPSYACMYLSGHCSIYITIRPSGLCTNTKSLRSHAPRGRFSGQCRLTALGTFAFMFSLV